LNHKGQISIILLSIINVIISRRVKMEREKIKKIIKLLFDRPVNREELLIDRKETLEYLKENAGSHLPTILPESWHKYYVIKHSLFLSLHN
jgi:hypothetical protein